MDKVFKALADPGRRLLLDRLRQDNGQTLGQLCEYLEMARQSVSQHLSVLESANLISTVRRGRLKLHYLNPVPLNEIAHRWISAFEMSRLEALHAVKQRAEESEMTDEMTETEGKPTFVYVTYIHSTPEKVWEALTDADLTAQYWGHSNVSDWRPGSRWEHVRTDGSGIADGAGEVLEATPPRRLVMTFGAPDDTSPSVVAFDIEQHHDIVRLTVTHEAIPNAEDYEAASAGWAAVVSNLKSLLETGRVLPQAPWEMHADLRARQMSR
ncbi:ArsR family transcriptional regulator [Mycolicibacterium agri]|uniref:ArsR family transcriptional regulator n=2 Tax=Mycolicibacterium agri TaxID=36811 RepID=A0A2A7ND78_MYCAG|nr:metalloregulator ArsR/SmtB family transcription factor [Mycolicibacterium agri]PEG42072.1 ArsR family transcriptional regulator [Mycolicibacterium agri]